MQHHYTSYKLQKLLIHSLSIQIQYLSALDLNLLISASLAAALGVGAEGRVLRVQLRDPLGDPGLDLVVALVAVDPVLQDLWLRGSPDQAQSLPRGLRLRG